MRLGAACRLMRGLALGVLCFPFELSPLQAADTAPGLVVTLAARGATDLALFDGIQIYVPAGEAASPFIPNGNFTATWEGFIQSDIRADYTFLADAAGELSFAINDAIALAGKSTNGPRLQGPTVRLNKGANKLKLEFKSPAAGDSFIRLYWSNRETPLNPVPKTAFTHTETVELASSLEVHAGRDLFAEYRCGKCHASPTGMEELAKDAPRLSGIGSLLQFDWLAEWIRDPRALQAGTHMPTLFAGGNAQEQAEAVAAYLVSLTGEPPPEATAGSAQAGSTLSEKLDCVVCHGPNPLNPSKSAPVSLERVGAKFASSALASFLAKPEARYSWTQMPNFRLSTDEAADLAAWLTSKSEMPPARSRTDSPALVETGRKLVANSGCLNCHAIAGSRSELTAKPLADLPADRWAFGCLAETPTAESRAPRFILTAAQRKALRAFGATDRTSLSRNVAMDFAERQSQHLNCRACHDKIEGLPAFDLIGEKLKPEWATKFIAGLVEVKPRPWLESRMPAFPAFATNLGIGLAAFHGLPPPTPGDLPTDPELAEAGQRLVSSKGGFSCISCHGAGEFAATRVFEAPGINFAQTYERVQPEFFRRWVRNPSSINPTSKMPAFFDEDGQSPLREVFDGDGPKTIRALWEYIRLGDQMPPPE